MTPDHGGPARRSQTVHCVRHLACAARIDPRKNSEGSVGPSASSVTVASAGSEIGRHRHLRHARGRARTGRDLRGGQRGNARCPRPTYGSPDCPPTISDDSYIND